MKNLHRYLAMLFVFISLSMTAQNASISGLVVDELGDPIIGATVMEKGTNNGTVTDYDGNFKLGISKGPLVVSYVGMKTQEVNVAGKSQIKVTLLSNAQDLDEVVVIGYGTAKKKDLTGALSMVKGDQLAKIPVTNAAEAITGRLAGVQVTTADGSPDAEIIIRVRGGGSVTGDNSPLYIVDGFPVSSLGDISSSDIEDITVLKDASSTAIYGSQGANGVVLITTKGAKSGKTTVNYNGYLQAKNLSKRMNVLDTYEYVLYNYEKLALTGEDGIKTFEKRFGSYEDIDLYKKIDAIDWQDDMFGSDVISQQHNISISGGTDKTKFSFSGTYNKNGGLMKQDQYERYNANFKLNHEISKNVKFSFNLRATDTTVDGSGTSGGNYKVRTTQAVTSVATNGLSDFTTPDRSTMTDDEWDEYLRSTMSLSEQAAQYWKKRLGKIYNLTSSIDWKIIKQLSYRIEGGYDYGFNETKNYWGELTSNASYIDGLPLVDWTKENTRKARVANTLTYTDTFGKHNFNVMVGQEIVNTMKDNNYIYATSFSADLSPEKIFANLALSSSNLKATSKVNTEDRLASFFGRLGYNYDDRYLLTVTFRADGSSKFKRGNRWGYFPAASAAWRINQEEFMEGTKDYLSNLKLRLSYGTAGNNKIASTLYQLDYKISATKPYGWGDQACNYYEPTNSQMPNPDLKWETTITRNVGLDFGFLDERFTGTIDAYWNTTKDLLLERSIVAPGYSTMYENVGQTSNKGIELTLNATILQHKDYSLNATFNIGKNKSNVDKLVSGSKYMEFASGWAGTDLKGYNDFQVKEGSPLGVIMGWKSDGYYTTDDFERYDETSGKYILKEGVSTCGMLGGSIGIRPGTIKLKDETKNGVVDDDDRTVIGNTTPDFTGGFGLNGTFHGFDASVMFSFVYGNDIYNANKIATSQSYRSGSYNNLLGFMKKSSRYTYLNESTGQIVTDLATLAEMNEGKNKKAYWSPMSFGSAVAVPYSWAIEDGSFLRLQNVTVGYTVPKKLSRKVLIEKFRVYCTLNNVYCWTNYSGYDPEVSSPVRGSSTSGVTPGVDYSSYPKSFSWLAGVNITF